MTGTSDTVAIQVKNRRVYLHQVNLGPTFVDMSANATVDPYGRVHVYVAPATRVASFYTTVDRLPHELVRAILERLNDAHDDRQLAKLATKLRASLTKRGE